MGQGPDANGKEDPAKSFCIKSTVACEVRNVLPSHGKYQLSAHGSAVHHAAAGHDRAFLSGLAADGSYRLAALFGFDLLDFEFLPGVAKRVTPENLVADFSLHAVRDGHWNWNIGAQRASCD